MRQAGVSGTANQLNRGRNHPIPFPRGNGKAHNRLPGKGGQPVSNGYNAYQKSEVLG